MLIALLPPDYDVLYIPVTTLCYGYDAYPVGCMLPNWINGPAEYSRGVSYKEARYCHQRNTCRIRWESTCGKCTGEEADISYRRHFTNYNLPTPTSIIATTFLGDIFSEKRFELVTMAFSCFARLPIELQAEVWHHALLAESQDRVVLLNVSNHAIPQRHLASPFLSAVWLSRHEALHFYTVALEVRDVPLFRPPFGDDCRSILRTPTISAFNQSLAQMHEFERRGTVYLNHDHDTFITGLDFMMHYATTSGIGNAARPITEILPPAACQQVRHLVVAQRVLEYNCPGGVTLEGREDRPNEPDLWLQDAVYSQAQAEELWDRSTFNGCTTFQHTWVSIEREERGFGDGFGSQDYLLPGPEACAWYLMGLMDETGAAGAGAGWTFAPGPWKIGRWRWQEKLWLALCPILKTNYMGGIVGPCISHLLNNNNGLLAYDLRYILLSCVNGNNSPLDQ